MPEQNKSRKAGISTGKFEVKCSPQEKKEIKCRPSSNAESEPFMGLEELFWQCYGIQSKSKR